MKANEKKLTWLAGFSHFMTHGYMSLLPALLVVITAEHSLSFTDIGIIANVGYFLYGLGAFPAGYLSDKFGSKMMLTIGASGMAVCSIMVGLSSGAVGFAITYALLGVFASIHHPAGLSLIARRVETKKGKALGLHGVLGNVGMFLTPMVAGLGVMYFRTWRSAYIIYGLVGLVFALVIHLTKVEEEADLNWRGLLNWPKKLFSGAIKVRVKKERELPAGETEADSVLPTVLTIIPVSLLLLYAGSVLSGFIFRGSLTFFPALLQREVHFINIHDESVAIAATVTTAVLSLGLIGAWFGGWINDKIRRPELFPILLFIIVSPLLYLISIKTDSPLLLVSCLFSLFYYAWQPSHNYLISKYTKKASHGMGFGINFFLIFGIGSIATAIGGYMADEYSVDRFYFLMSVLGCITLLAAIGVYAARSYLIKLNWKLVKENNHADQR